MPRQLIFGVEASIVPVKSKFNGASPDEISPFFKESYNALMEQWGFDQGLQFQEHDRVLALEIVDKPPNILSKECFGQELQLPFPEYLPVRIFKDRKQGEKVRLVFKENRILVLKCTGKVKSFFDANFEEITTRLIGD